MFVRALVRYERCWSPRMGGRPTPTVSNVRFERRSKRRQDEEDPVYGYGRIFLVLPRKILFTGMAGFVYCYCNQAHREDARCRSDTEDDTWSIRASGSAVEAIT